MRKKRASFLASRLAGLLHAAGLDEKRCVSCLEPFTPAGGPLPLCPSCLERLPRRLAGYCPHCGEIAAAPDAPRTPCGVCLKRRPPWNEFRFYGVFSGLLRELLHRGKFAADAACLDLLGRMLLEVCRDLPPPGAIVPMPLHPTRLRGRGYNQCREIALPLAGFLHVPLRDDLLLRVRPTPPQTDLDREKRLTNLDGAFNGLHKAKGLRVLLVDDTATTGTSLRMASEALLRAGALSVDVAIIAHASIHESEVVAT